MRRLTMLIALALLVPASQATAAENAKVNYEEHLRPIFADKCFSCHNPDKRKGGLALTTYGALMEGGSSGAVVEAGDAESSRLYLLVSHAETPKMPPNAERLPDAALATFRAWIDGGLLENAGSKAVKSKRPKVDLSIKNAGERPEGPPPMPAGISLDPIFVSAKPATIGALAASPWAPLVAVGGHRQVLLYHSVTRELLGVLPFPEGVPQVMRFSRSGGLLLAAGGHAAKSGRVVVFDVRSGERVVELGEEYDAVLAADISPDQTLVALGGSSRVVRVYATADGELQFEIKKHTEWIFDLEFSPDGVLLATADRNGGLFVWESWTGREYQSLRGHSAAVTSVSWRADGGLLASASEDARIMLWEMEGGRQVRRWNAHGGGALSVRFARDGRLVSAGRDRQVKLWDQSGKQLRAFAGLGDVATAAVIADSGGGDATAERVIGGDWRGTLRVWGASDGKPTGDLVANPPSVATRLASATTAYEATRAAHDDLAKRLAALEAEHEKTVTELSTAKDAAAKATTALASTRGELEKTRAGTEESGKAFVAVLASLKQKEESGPQGASGELEKTQGEAVDAAAKALDLIKRRVTLYADVRKLESELAGSTARVKQLESRPAQLEAEIAKLRESLGATASKLAMEKREFDRWTLASRLDASLAVLEAKRLARQAALLELEEETTELEGIDADIVAAEKELAKLRTERERGVAKVEREKKKVDAAAAEVEAARKAVEESSGRLADLR